MNKKTIALLLALLLLLSGCKAKNNAAAEATDAPETIAVTEENTPTETLHPALTDNPFGDGWTEPSEPVQAGETTAATEASKETEAPEETEAPKATEAPDATEPAAKPTEAPEDNGEMNYDKYMSMSAKEQSDYMNSFESVDAFFAWYNAAKAEHDAQNPDIEVGDGSFDLGELEGNN